MTDTTAKTYTLIDGRKIASEIKAEILQLVNMRRAAEKKIPHLAIILVGDDGAPPEEIVVLNHYTDLRDLDADPSQWRAAKRTLPM